MLSSAQSVRKRSMRAELCSGPCPSKPCGSSSQPGGVLPLVLGGHDELVDDDLGTVDEVAELGLPADERVLVLDRVAVLEADRRVLAQQRVVDEPLALVLGEVGQGQVLLTAVEVDLDRVPLREGPAPRVLSGDPDVGALEQQRPERQRLAERPVDRARLVAFARLLEDAVELRVAGEAVRDVELDRRDPVERLLADAGLDGRQQLGRLLRSDRLRRLRRRGLLGLVERPLERSSKSPRNSSAFSIEMSPRRTSRSV
jgi:hypothetical protein